MRGLYIHIPFCRKKCPYCDFYSIPYDKNLTSQYLDILSQEIESLNKSISTLYIGGGTPTVLDESLLDVFLKKLGKILEKSKESTIEANPESLTKEKIKLFLRRGINRISIGIQSLNEKKLKFLGRIHSQEEAVDKVVEAKRLGFDNINVDLIYGLPYENLEELKKELKEILKLPITHLSCYMLTLEETSPLYHYSKDISEEKVARMYRFLMEYLPKRGFFQYEVSNFAKRGYHSRHNIIYWENKEYIGIGASSVSYIDHIRIKRVEDVRRYIRLIKEKKSPVVFEERLNSFERAKETAALNIRMKKGINFSEFEKKTDFNFWKIAKKRDIDRLVKRGWLRYRKRKEKVKGIFPTSQGFLFVDEVSSLFV